MSPLKGMTPLQNRKRELLLESGLNRAVLQIEAGQWQLRAARWTSRLGKVHTLAKIANPLAQVFLARKSASLVRSLWAFFARRS